MKEQNVDFFTALATPETPEVVDTGTDKSVELGVRFKADTDGYVIGIRFYKAAANIGPHVANLWANDGTRLASATFSNETDSGWQQVNFETPVSISANTIYTASYHCPAGHYSETPFYFETRKTDGAPLHVLRDGGNGVASYEATSRFPNQISKNSNYWVDVVFQPASITERTIWPSSAEPDVIDAELSIPEHPNECCAHEVGVKFRSDVDGLITGIRFYKASANTGIDFVTLWSDEPHVARLARATFTNQSASGWQQVNFTTPVSITANTPYAASFHSWSSHYSKSDNYFPNSAADNAPLHAYAGGLAFTYGLSSFPFYSGGQTQTTNYWVDVVFLPSPSTEQTIWPNSAIPAVTDNGPDAPVELGVKFKSDTGGYISGIRFYKASSNIGPHVVNLWANDGTLLASAPSSAPFGHETESGWQQVNFACPVGIMANTIYRASYHCPNGHFSVDRNYFSGQGTNNGSLLAPADGMYGGNGVARYGGPGSFPDTTWSASNYWVDVVFQANSAGLRVWPSSAVPAVVDALYGDPAIPFEGGAHEAGVRFRSDIDGYIIGIRYYKSPQDAGGEFVNLWSDEPHVALLARRKITNLTESGWQQINFGAPVRITANNLYVASYHSWSWYYSKTDNYFPNSEAESPPLHASAGCAVATYGMSSFPGPGTWSKNTNYWVDAVFLPSSIAEHTIWPGTTLPSEIDAGPDNPVELGVKFQSAKNGYITGIKFYKWVANGGSHVAHFWSNDGTLLASAPFRNETEIGWQRANFVTPVPITANTLYRASYHCPNGHFSVNRNYFTGQSIDSGPLHAPADGMNGGNGVARYGGPGSFPDTTWAASNYWVDVIFVEE